MSQWNPPPGSSAPRPWPSPRSVDFVVRFGPDLGPAMKSVIQSLAGGRLPPEDLAREACRALARAMGSATHAHVDAAGAAPLTGVRVPTNAYDDGAILVLRVHLNVPMTSPVDSSNATQVAGVLHGIIGLPRGSVLRTELGVAEPTRDPAAPLLTTLNTRTLPGQKLCPFCKNPMPDYETQCGSCGARSRT